MDAPPTPAKQDKAALLAAFYGHLGRRITSLGRRSSFLIAFLASFLNRVWFESGSSRGLGLVCPVPI